MIIDNSEYMRNGDYQPTRFDAQADAVNVVFQTKTDSNPENTVGIMTSAGKCPEVLVTHTKDIGQILQGIHVAGKKIGGEIDIPTAINIAQLALKHRENKNLRQRIIVFVGSPLEGQAADEKNMVKLAKKLKKNNVAVDVVSFGDGIEEADAEGKTVLKSFVENVNSGDNSHLLSVAPGALLLSDALITSAVLAADRGALIPEELQAGGGGGEASGSGGGFEFGVDPSLDPELAMPQHQGRSSSAAASSAEPADENMDDDEEELKRALAMSEEKDVDMEGDEEDEEDEDEDEDLDEDEDEDEDEDAAIARAIEMSMQSQKEEEGAKKK
ncbi:hypothetical protein H1R20_g6405, partial [Candolleomyces eurysporus]